MIASAFLAAQTASSATPWTATLSAAQIVVPTSTVTVGTPVTLSLTLNGVDVTNARITWEARDQLPAFGTSYTLTPKNSGTQWVEVEIAYPDGRRIFLTNNFSAQ